CQQFKSYPYSF
nr:immunoglobulin light chain junction region [Macaca mulatta]